MLIQSIYISDSWVNFYGNIGKTLLSLVSNLSVVQIIFYWYSPFFYHFELITINMLFIGVLFSEINITSWRSCLPLTLLCSFLHWFWDDTLCRSLCSLTLFSCVNILSYILATKLTSLPSQIKRGQNHWLSLPTTQHQKTCKD